MRVLFIFFFFLYAPIINAQKEIVINPQKTEIISLKEKFNGNPPVNLEGKEKVIVYRKEGAISKREKYSNNIKNMPVDSNKEKIVVPRNSNDVISQEEKEINALKFQSSDQVAENFSEVSLEIQRIKETEELPSLKAKKVRVINQESSRLNQVEPEVAINSKLLENEILETNESNIGERSSNNRLYFILVFGLFIFILFVKSKGNK